jgi:ribosomal protein L37AE/L43A
MSKIRSWLLELSLKLFPVKEPLPTKIIYSSHNACPDCNYNVELVSVRKGVWMCPHCVRESIAVTVNSMQWYQQHPGTWRKQWLENKRREMGEKTIPLIAIRKIHRQNP